MYNSCRKLFSEEAQFRHKRLIMQCCFNATQEEKKKEKEKKKKEKLPCDKSLMSQCKRPRSLREALP